MPMMALSHLPMIVSVSMASNSIGVSPAVSTGVFPYLTTWRGPDGVCGIETDDLAHDQVMMAVRRCLPCDSM